MEGTKMLDFLYHISDTSVFLFMLIITVSFSLILITLSKIFILHKLHYEDNTVTASVASLIGIIYGVLAGFTCLYLLNNNDHASVAALNEGTAAANIYRESKWLKPPQQQQLQSNLKKYITNVITLEWPEMVAGKTTHIEDVYLIDDMSETLMQYPMSTPADPIIIQDLIQEIKTLFNARQERLNMSENELSPDIWLVMLLGTVLIIVINYAFRVNFYLHLFTISIFSLMAASVMFLLVTLDRPFQGEFIVEPTALQAVLTFMEHDKNLSQ
jgi:hypothetical protein